MVLTVNRTFVRGRRVRNNAKPCYRWSERKQCWILQNPEDVRLDQHMPLKVWPAANIWLMPYEAITQKHAALARAQATR